MLLADPDGASISNKIGVIRQEKWANIWNAVLAASWPDER
jgi:hypothetical protein